MTYYKYQARELDEVIDWNAVGSSISKSLDDIGKEREKKRDDVEASTDNLLKKLDEAPLGEHKNLNIYNLETQDTLQNGLLTQKKLLQAGKIKYKDFLKYRQNVFDGADSFTGLIKDYNQNYQKYLDDYEKDPSAMNAFTIDQIEGFMNFSETKVVVDAQGNTVIAKYGTDENGNKVLSDEVATLNSLRNRITQSYPSFKVDDNLKPMADSFAEKFNTLAKEKGIRSWDDIRKHESYGKVSDNIVNSFLDSDYNVQSVLTDYLMESPDGKKYRLSTNEEDINDPNVIFMEFDKNSGQPVPRPTEEQKKIAEEALAARLETMIKSSFTLPQEFAPQRPVPKTAFEIKQGNAEQQFDDKASLVGQIYYGSKKEKLAAVESLAGLSDDIQNIQVTEKGVVINYMPGSQRGKSEPIDFYDQDGNLKSQEDFIRSATALTGEGNMKKALERGWYDPNREFLAETVEHKGKVVENVYKEASDWLSSEVGDRKSFFKKTEEAALGDVQAIVGKLGYVAEETGEGAIDQIVVKDSKGNEIVTLEFDTDNPDSEFKKLRNLFEGIPESELREIMKAAKTTSENKEDDPLGIK